MGVLRIAKPKRAPTSIQAASSGSTVEIALSKFFRLVPAEVMTIYPAGSALIPEAHAPVSWAWGWACLGLCLLLRVWQTRGEGRGPQLPAVGLSLFAALVWIHMLDRTLGPYTVPEGYGYVITLIALIISAIAALFYPEPEE